jgi:hypothetical protein
MVPRSKYAWSYPSIPQYAFMASCPLNKAQEQLHIYLYRDNLTFTFTFSSEEQGKPVKALVKLYSFCIEI